LLIFSGAVAVEPIDWSKGTAAMKIFEDLKKNMAPNLEHTSPVDFLMVAGDGREDEVIFRWANGLEKDGTVANVTTVSLGSRNTEAGCTLTQGVTGKLSTPIHHDYLLTQSRSLDSSPEARTASVNSPRDIDVMNVL
jgi:trehalose-6-phosphatase